MKINQLKAGSLLSYLQMGVGLVIGLLYTPLMIRLLGQSEYGLYNTASSTISMLAVLNLGFNSGYIRFYSKYKKNNDKESISKLNGLFIIIFVVIGLVALICGLILSQNLKMIFKNGLTESELQTAKVLFLLLTANLAISFPMSVFSNIVSAHERFVFLKTLGMIKTVLSPLVTLPLLLMGYRSIAMVSVTVMLALITDVIYLYYVLKVLKCRFVFHGFEKGLFKSLFGYTSFIAINIIIDQINLNIDKVLLGRFCGTAMVSVYSVGYTLYTYYQLLSTSISGVFTPRIHSIITKTEDLKQQRKLITDLFIRVGRIQFIILALVSSGMVFFGKRFIEYWAGEGYSQSYYVALLLILPSSIALIQNLGIEIQRAENKHQFRSICYAVMAIINLILSIYLCQLYGAVGSAVGTAISLIVANGLIMNIYYQKKCNIDIILFWKNIMRMSVGLILPVISGVVMIKLFYPTTVLLLLIEIVIYSCIYALSMWFIAINKYEKELVMKPIKMITNKAKAIINKIGI